MTSKRIEPAPRLTLQQEVGLLVHAVMWRQRVTQRDLAAAIGRDQATLSRKLRGTVAMTVPELIEIATALGVDVVELLPTAMPMTGTGDTSEAN